MSPAPFVYSARLSDDHAWSFCTLCGDVVTTGREHHCDDGCLRGAWIAIAASLVVVLVLVGALVAGSAW